MTRITGINSGLDVDALVKASMTTYQSKIDTETQNKKVLEYQQEQYKQIMSDASNFHDKYFDILKTGNLMSTTTYNTVSFTPSDSSKVTAKGFAGAAVSGYTVKVDTIASKATTTLTTSELTTSLNHSGSSLTLTIGGKPVTFDIKAKTSDSTAVDIDQTTSALNAALNAAGIDVSAKYSEFSGGIVIETGKTGASQTFTVAGLKDSNGTPLSNKVAEGTNFTGTITKDGVTPSKVLNETSNIVTIDNVQFTVKAPTTGGTTGTGVTLAGTTNVTDLKDKIVSFINDYNTLLQSINTKIYETRDKDYMPLTDTQKEAMTESQITAWEKKAQTGLLRKDSDLQRIASEMKSAISTVMSGSRLYMDKIGITPVKSYAEKNGTLTIDEDKLTQALEENAGNVKDLFTRAASSTTTEKGGVITQLKSVLYDEFKKSSSLLAKKAGLEGTTSEYSNTLTKSIAKKKQEIYDLNDLYTTKETALYNKYSALETAMQKLSSQQSSLASMLGTS